MKVEVERKGTDEEIELGDMFISNKGQAYVLKKITGKYALHNINEDRNYLTFHLHSTLEEEIRNRIKFGELTHYPKKKYKLKIVPINN